ncbi:hypothetical protein D3C73_1054160 [compost metagenome]
MLFKGVSMALTVAQGISGHGQRQGEMARLPSLVGASLLAMASRTTRSTMNAGSNIAVDHREHVTSPTPPQWRFKGSGESHSRKVAWRPEQVARPSYLEERSYEWAVIAA